jgi:hypothetical protein
MDTNLFCLEFKDTKKDLVPNGNLFLKYVQKKKPMLFG